MIRLFEVSDDGKGENRSFARTDRLTPAIAVKGDETGLIEEIIFLTI